jgi:hypothetical protein
MKFIAYQDCFPNKQSQIIYILSLLYQNVVLMTAPLLDTSVLPCGIIGNLVTHPITLYGKPDCPDSSKRELDSLCQTNWEFMAYYANF